MVLRGMQCGATALIVNVGIDLLVKQGKKKLILPMLIIIGTFIANLFFDTNIMVLILITASSVYCSCALRSIIRGCRHDLWIALLGIF